MDIGQRIQTIVSGFAADAAGRSVAVRVVSPFGLDASAAGDVARPAASVIKLPVIMALLRAAEAGQADLDERVAVAGLPTSRYASVMTAFEPMSTLSLGEMAALAIITSDNPLAVHLQERVGLEAVNELLAELGCSEAARMAAGFSEAELGPANRANRLTAEDALCIVTAIHEDPIYRPLERAMENNLRNGRMPALLDEDVTVAHKTGSLDGVVNDAGFVSRGEAAFYAAFLTEGQDDALQTERAIAETTRAILAVLDRKTLLASAPIDDDDLPGRDDKGRLVEF